LTIPPVLPTLGNELEEVRTGELHRDVVALLYDCWRRRLPKLDTQPWSRRQEKDGATNKTADVDSLTSLRGIKPLPDEQNWFW
jgi:hypothetical protein